MSIPSPFRIRRVEVNEHGFRYATYLVEGYLDGARVRRKFRDHAEALSAKTVLDIQSGNALTAVRLVPSRLNEAQIADAEYCFRRLGDKASLTTAVEWYLNNYRPPAVEMDLSTGSAEYQRSKEGRVMPRHLAEVRRQLAAFAAYFPGRSIHSFKRQEIQAYLDSRKDWAPKTWNNVRGILFSLFAYGCDPDRAWAVSNPVRGIDQMEVPRGLPDVKSAAEIAALFDYLKTYTGGVRCGHPPGFLIPYFALATFAGLRPSIPSGEIWKMSKLPDLRRMVDVDLGVIRITPEIAKTGEVRQVKMRPNLRAWLQAYPLKDHPLVMPNMSEMLVKIRSRFALGHDVLRHTFISMHVARFKSLGEAALEAGNSEAIIRRHYLNMVSEEEAEEFWNILPSPAGVDEPRKVA